MIQEVDEADIRSRISNLEIQVERNRKVLVVIQAKLDRLTPTKEDGKKVEGSYYESLRTWQDELDVQHLSLEESLRTTGCFEFPEGTLCTRWPTPNETDLRNQALQLSIIRDRLRSILKR